MKRIEPTRVSRAIIAIHQWWGTAHNQGGKHLLPLLALLERGAGTGQPVRFEERPDEYDFWDRYFRVAESGAKPYFNPITRQFGEENYPHSNAATIRKKTFHLSWNAASLTDGPKGESMWMLAQSYAEIFATKALSKGGQIARVPAVDLAAFMLRNDKFPDDADVAFLVASFRQRFPQKDEDFERLFVVRDEPPEKLYTFASPSIDAYTRAIIETLIEENPPSGPATRGDESTFPDDDAILIQVRELLGLNSSGIILRGVPGTSKSWYARRIAMRLVDDDAARIHEVQFHPSLGYEDFVEGYKPDETSKSGFQVVDKQFVLACQRAGKVQGHFVFIIDEINRGDPARIFGDLLTYIERDYRDRKFPLPFSGNSFSIPSNLVLIGTMNPYDHSVTQLDAALVRRFDHINLPPSTEKVGEFLEAAGVFTSAQVSRVQEWFDILQRLLLPQGIGHTYFKDVRKLEHLQSIWRYRMLPVCESALELEQPKLQRVRETFDSMYADVSAANEATSKSPAASDAAPTSAP